MSYYSRVGNCVNELTEKEYYDIRENDVKCYFVEETKYGSEIIDEFNFVNDLFDMIKCSMNAIGIEYYWIQLITIRNHHEIFKFSNVSVHQKYELNRYILYVGVLGKDIKGIDIRVNRKLEGYLSELSSQLRNINDIILGAYDDFVKKYKNVRVCEGKYDCILSPEITGMLIHECVGHMAESNVLEYEEYTKLKCSNKRLSVYDVADLIEYPDIPCPLVYDDEGESTTKVCLIYEGSFCQQMISSQSVNYMGTGNVRMGIDGKKMIRMRNTFLQKGVSHVPEMFKAVKNGYFLSEASLGCIQKDGEFQLFVNKAYEIINGCIVSSVEDVMLRGNAFNFLDNISMLSDEIHWHSLICGKRGSDVFVGVGAPYVKARVELKPAHSMWNEKVVNDAKKRI